MRRQCRDGYGPAAQSRTGERAEDSAIGACRGQIDTDAGDPLHDARSDLDQPKADRCELCVVDSGERFGAASRIASKSQ